MYLKKFASDYFAIKPRVFVLQCKIEIAEGRRQGTMPGRES
jgi:hypothetical protein